MDQLAADSESLVQLTGQRTHGPDWDGAQVATAVRGVGVLMSDSSRRRHCSEPFRRPGLPADTQQHTDATSSHQTALRYLGSRGPGRGATRWCTALAQQCVARVAPGQDRNARLRSTALHRLCCRAPACRRRGYLLPSAPQPPRKSARARRCSSSRAICCASTVRVMDGSTAARTRACCESAGHSHSLMAATSTVAS